MVAVGLFPKMALKWFLLRRSVTAVQVLVGSGMQPILFVRWLMPLRQKLRKCRTLLCVQVPLSMQTNTGWDTGTQSLLTIDLMSGRTVALLGVGLTVSEWTPLWPLMQNVKLKHLSVPMLPVMFRISMPLLLSVAQLLWSDPVPLAMILAKQLKAFELVLVLQRPTGWLGYLGPIRP